MSIRLSSVCFALAWLLCAVPCARSGQFFPLGDLPGGDYASRARAVSADGPTVVGDSDVGLNEIEAFRWTLGTGLVSMGDLVGGDRRSTGHDVSGDGSVVVGAGSSGATGSEAWRWQDGMTGLGDLGTGMSVATGVSRDGQVVVGQLGSGPVGNQAFRWTAESGIVPLGDLPGGTFSSVALSVSADGTVVVGETTTAPGRVPFRWTADTGLVDLGFLGTAYGVSADGQSVVGQAGNHGFLWQGGSTVDLGVLGEGPATARNVTDDGTLVVGTVFSPLQTAFIWNAVHGMRDLGQVLTDEHSIDLAGWRLTSAEDISADGRVIVGTGINPDGHVEAWVFVVPEPSGLGIAVVGSLAFLAAGARKRRWQVSERSC